MSPLDQVKQPALFSQYGEVRKVEPPAVGPGSLCGTGVEIEPHV